MKDLLAHSPPITQAANPQPAARAAAKATQQAQGEDFNSLLEQRLRFSNHAQKRLERQGIELSPDHIDRLSQAVERAEKHHSRSTLVLVDDLAYVVNVPERTIVTAVDSQRRGEGVFTQIDSVVIADPTTRVDIQG